MTATVASAGLDVGNDASACNFVDMLLHCQLRTEIVHNSVHGCDKSNRWKLSNTYVFPRRSHNIEQLDQALVMKSK